MKKIIPLIIIISVMSGLLVSCGESGAVGKTPPVDVPPLADGEKDALVPTLADFSVEVFKRAFSQKSDTNNLVSPLSVLIALSMTANGADGDTLSEMESVFGGLPVSDFNRLLSGYVNNLPSEKVSKLNVANSVWIRDDERLTVHESFINANKEQFAAEIKKAPFDADTVRDIKKWVSLNTDKMIEQVVDEIPNDTVMYLINAIVFDSQWEKKYEKKDVGKRNFYAFDGRVQNTDFMSSTENKYIKTEDAVGVIKPYKNGHYSFAALLPNEDVDIADFVADMTGESLVTALESARNESVSVYLPKFTFEYDIVMNDLLIEMGMESAFDPGLADFSRLGYSEAGNIFISEVLHKTYIEVDEKGTKAAAVTSVKNRDNATAAPVQPVILDRPFVFAIVDNDAGVPVFMGVLMNIPS
ncbi:MAG: serpin family protein [Oscillospiraceae bacterium]|nr:serpin family protein [Oscillospiraceae bacterium]